MLANGFSKCTCLAGYIESPNTIRGCVEPKNPCEPSPCGFGAVCDASRTPVCSCPEPLIGNPFRVCENPVVTELCHPGPCGRNANCYVTNNLEQCYCKPGFIGDPYSGCREPPRTVCEPSPCGPGAECSISPDGQSMCRCPDGLGGDPTSLDGCHGYECRVDDDCGYDQACFGFRCQDPCPGVCGSGATCRVEKHHPVCSCLPGLTGNPVVSCYQMDEPAPPTSLCQPSPCGPNTHCSVQNGKAICSCLSDNFGDPSVGCRPECTMNSECPSDKACVNKRCRSPCDGSVCGINAECHVYDHTATCACVNGFNGDAFIHCLPIAISSVNTTRNPCIPSPCGPQNQCNVYGDFALCDPCFGPDAINIPSCRPKCVTSSDCPFDKACLGHNCVDPCPGSCGHNAICEVRYHNPMCSCPPGLYGNPYEYCSRPTIMNQEPETCDTIRCGANTECRQQNDVLACVCKPGYYGDPLIGCRPECVINPDCSSDKACSNLRCIDPCHGACGLNALCQVVNHIAVCYCSPDRTGDAHVACTRPQLPPPVVQQDIFPCDPSPCGPNSRCLPTANGQAVCSCLPGYRGSSPACQPECVSSSECSQNMACINNRCADPCPGICGNNARCEVINHNPICSCRPGQEGDPFVSCYTVENKQNIPPTTAVNPCVPSPCGPNSICQIKQGRPVCSCTANYIGSPPHCRPECVLNNDCPQDKACIREKCEDPCRNSCGANAECRVVSHAAHCNCLAGYQGDAFNGCTRVPDTPIIAADPCHPSPCGENSVCSERNGVAKCACIPPYIGDPYRGGCRPECQLNSECPSNQACIRQHCRDPCPGICGSNAECAVVNHIPSCACVRGYEGDPFQGCHPIRQAEPPTVTAPCDPSPCGPNSVCRNVADRPICSCQVGFVGAPPRCRPECVVNSECDQNMACINQKCRDPCPGTCGFQARCQVINHNPICSCPNDYIGNPFEKCSPARKL